MAAGLALHVGGAQLPPAARDKLGDTLWAAMIAWWAGAAAPSTPLRWRAVSALVVCVAVEFSQLWHAPLLDWLRSGTAGHLVLGSGFDPRDLPAYAAGVLGVAFFESAAWRRYAAGAESERVGRR
jgi:hypothetical protein